MASLNALPWLASRQIASHLQSMNDLAAYNSTCRATRNGGRSLMYKIAARHFPYLLCWACEFGDLGLVRTLLQYEVNPNQPYRCPTYGAGETRELLKTQGLNLDAERRQSLRSVYHHDQQLAWMRGRLGLSTISDQSRNLLKGSNIQPPLVLSPTEQKSLDEDWNEDYFWRLTTALTDGTSYEPHIYDSSAFWYPMHCAALGGHDNITTVLLEHGASLHVPSNGVMTRLTKALHNKLVEPVPVLDSRSYVKFTPLCIGLYFRQQGTAKRLLESGADPVFGDNDGHTTAFHMAAATACVDIMSFFVSKGTMPIDAEDSRTSTPFVYAVEAGEIESVSWLMDNHANMYPTVPNEGVFSPIHQACRMGYYDMVVLLSQAVGPVWPEAAPALNWPFPMHFHYSAEVVYAHLTVPMGPIHMCCLNGPANSSGTDTAISFQSSRVSAIDSLLRIGATVDALNDQEASAIDHAASMHLIEVIDLFEIHNIDFANHGKKAIPMAISQTHVWPIPPWLKWCLSGKNIPPCSESTVNTVQRLLSYGAPIQPYVKELQIMLLDLWRSSSEGDQSFLDVLNLLMEAGLELYDTSETRISLFTLFFTGGCIDLCESLRRSKGPPSRECLIATLEAGLHYYLLADYEIMKGSSSRPWVEVNEQRAGEIFTKTMRFDPHEHLLTDSRTLVLLLLADAMTAVLDLFDRCQPDVTGFTPTGFNCMDVARTSSNPKAPLVIERLELARSTPWLRCTCPSEPGYIKQYPCQAHD